MEKILIIDDDVTFSLMLRTWLGKKGFGVDTAADIAAGRRLLAEGSYDLVLSDMRLPDGDGTDLLQWIAERGVTIPVIVMTGYAEIRNAVVSMKLGARDYVSKPVQPDELLRKIREALDAPHPETAMPASAAMAPAPAKPRRKGDRALDEGELNYIEGHSDASRKLYEYVRLVAPTNMSVLLEGASGTGKEHVARLIHLRSKRAGKPFVAVDCGALSRELAASEFFGHIKGSFTGALSDKKGAFESAQGGTLFLDEVGNLSYEVQIQLLRALQERRIKPVGGLREIPVDVRLICATNEDLEAAIARGSFRADLYHRIDEFVLHMPDLAERREDIMLYADFFLDQANRELDKRVVGFDPEAEKLLVACDWPGNLRQLKNAVTRAVLLTTGEYVTPAELPAELSEAVPAPIALRDPAGEEERIRRALAAAGGNKSQAARLLGIDRKTLYNKLHLYGIE
uniref:sigma-54-dependent transcriptional regulator n=1 Tax=Alistipes putredinis TaxID=28117 RepID=UPI003FD80C5E